MLESRKVCAPYAANLIWTLSLSLTPDMSGICRIASRPIAENHRTGCDGLGTDSLTHWKSQGCRGKHGVTTHYHSGLPQRVNVSRLQGWPEFQLLLAIRNAFVLTAETSSTLNIRSHCRKEWLPGVYTHAPHSKYGDRIRLTNAADYC